MDPFDVVRQFERAVAEYTGAPYCVSVTSCTAALLLAVAWHERDERGIISFDELADREAIEIPRRTYCSVPMSIIFGGARPVFRDEDWRGAYQLKPLDVWDCARRFTSGMFVAGQMQAVSFHQSKILGDSQGGALLHDNPEADKWLRKMRFDGRTEGVAPKDDDLMLGWHAYLSPDVAARLLWKLSKLPLHNEDLPRDDYSDVSLIKGLPSSVDEIAERLTKREILQEIANIVGSLYIARKRQTQESTLAELDERIEEMRTLIHEQYDDAIYIAGD